MTIAVDLGRKATNQTNKQALQLENIYQKCSQTSNTFQDYYQGLNSQNPCQNNREDPDQTASSEAV